MTIRDLIDKQGIRDQLFTSPATYPIPILLNHELSIESLSTQVYSQGIGNAFICGHDTNGKIGSGYLGVNGVQITIGESGLSATTLKRVTNPSNTFREYIRDTYHWDTTNSTATVDITNHKVIF